MSKKKGFSVTIDDAALNAQIDAAIKRNPELTAKRVRDCLLDLAGESSRRAPVKLGDLRDNCVATLGGVTVFAKNTEVLNSNPPSLAAFGKVSYGLPYALRQHEDLTLNHPKGGEAKFLERPFEERKQRYIKWLESIPEEAIKE